MSLLSTASQCYTAQLACLWRLGPVAVPVPENMGLGYGMVFLSNVQAELWSTSGLGAGHLVFGFPLCRKLFGMSQVEYVTTKT